MKITKLTKLNAKGFSHHFIFALIVVVIIALVGVRVILSSHAATQPVTPAGTYVFINMPAGNLTNITHEVTINNVPNLGKTDYFWSHQYYYMGGPSGQGGYIGIQGINRAVFSIFDWASPEASKICNVQKANFDGGNEPGTSCIISYTVKLHHTYRLSVTKVSQDANGNNWRGTVTDLTSGGTTTIATVNVPTSWGNIASNSIVWTEYFTSISSCASQPKSNVTFSHFTANNNKFTALASHTTQITQNSCTANSKIIVNNNNSFTEEM